MAPLPQNTDYLLKNPFYIGPSIALDGTVRAIFTQHTKEGDDPEKNYRTLCERAADSDDSLFQPPKPQTTKRSPNKIVRKSSDLFKYNANEFNAGQAAYDMARLVAMKVPQGALLEGFKLILTIAIEAESRKLKETEEGVRQFFRHRTFAKMLTFHYIRTCRDRDISPQDIMAPLLPLFINHFTSDGKTLKVVASEVQTLIDAMIVSSMTTLRLNTLGKVEIKLNEDNSQIVGTFHPARKEWDRCPEDQVNIIYKNREYPAPLSIVHAYSTGKISQLLYMLMFILVRLSKQKNREEKYNKIFARLEALLSGFEHDKKSPEEAYKELYRDIGIGSTTNIEDFSFTGLLGQALSQNCRFFKKKHTQAVKDLFPLLQAHDNQQQKTPPTGRSKPVNSSVTNEGRPSTPPDLDIFSEEMTKDLMSNPLFRNILRRRQGETSEGVQLNALNNGQ